MSAKAVNNIRQIRLAKKMTLEAVAIKAGTTHEQIRRLERGDRRLTHEWMIRLAKALGVQPTDFIGGNLSSMDSLEPTDKIMIDVVELLILHAREHPQLDAKLLAAIGKTVYNAALSGKLPKFKSGAPTAKRALRGETQRLVDYEINRSRSN